ncbi:MAG: MAPEG family protein [Emcibacteraceae bacterium]|nr:MAPEG family protein [Emcibacteraceae bacterium]MDG1859041.1 MAPEG family protein [Emcibacteraceae bacterium]
MLAYPVITGLCAGIMGIVAVILAGHVGSYRGKAKVGIGDGGDAELICRMRKQGNFTEYVPLALVLLGLLEMSGAAGATAIWVLGMMLVFSRILHPLGLNADGSPTVYRVVGMLGTLPMMLVTSIWLIYGYVSAM